jgi:hypothetical protein
LLSRARKQAVKYASFCNFVLVSSVLLAAAVGRAGGAIIFDAPSIALLRIETVSAGAWTPVSRIERQRLVKLDVLIEQVFRGPLRPGARLQIEAEQHEPVGRTFAVSGAWSGKTLETGLRYLVFSRTPSETLRVVDGDETTDVELALAFEDHRWPLGDLELRVGPVRSRLGPLFAEYLNARLPTTVSQGARQWDSILDFLEAPGLTPLFRARAAVAAMDAVLMAPPAPDQIVQRTVVMAFRLLSLPDENGFHNRVVATYLPNLLGQEGSERKRSAGQIFAAYPGDRASAAKALAAMPRSESRAVLEGWLAK